MISIRRFSSFLVGGVAAQGAAAISGLFLARWMPVEDYAVYTIAITLIGAIAMLTKGNVRMGLSALLSKVWPNRAAAAEAVASALRVRLAISALAMPPIFIFAWFLLAQTDASQATVWIILAILGLVWLGDMHGSVIDQLLHFDEKSVRVQSMDTVIAIGRMLLILALKLINAVSVFAALIVNLVAVFARIPMIQRWVRQSLEGEATRPDPRATREIGAVALRQLPVDLFAVLQVQAVIFFLTSQGGEYELATYGAIGRIAQLLTPLNAVCLAFFVPAFAKVTDRVVSRISVYLLVGALPGIGLTAVSAFAPHLLLFFIGPAYYEQTVPLLVCAAAVSVVTVIQIAWNLVSHRGWNRWGWIRIPIGLAWCAIAPFLLPVGTAEGANVFFAGFSIGTLAALACDLIAAQKRKEITLFGSRRA